MPVTNGVASESVPVLTSATAGATACSSQIQMLLLRAPMQGLSHATQSNTLQKLHRLQTDSSVQEEAESCTRLLTGALMGLGGAEGQAARKHLVQCDCGTGVGVRAFSYPEPSKRSPGQQGSLMTRCKAHTFPVTKFKQPLSLVMG